MKKLSDYKIYTNGNDTPANHRGDFETCPSCDKKYDSKIWDKQAIELLRESSYNIESKITIFSECPNCNYRSWIHHPIDSFEYSDFPASWKKEVKKLADERHLKALRDWGASLCWQCRKLKSGEIRFNTSRSCQKGFGPALLECEFYGQIKHTSL